MKVIYSKRIIFLFFLFTGAARCWGQTTLYWNFGTGTANASATTISGSTGITASSVTANNSYGTNATPINTTSVSSGYTGASGSDNIGVPTKVGAFDITSSTGSAYFSVTLTPAAGYKVNLTNVNFGTRSTSTGPQAYTIRTSADNFATDAATAVIANNSTWTLKSNTLSVTGAINTPVEIRIYGYSGAGNATSGTINWRVDDLTLIANAVAGTTAVVNTWLGGTGDWNTASNWSTGSVPTSTDSVIIPAGITVQPAISSGSYNVGAFRISTGDTLSIAAGSSLNIINTLSDSGVIAGAGTAVLNGTAIQLISGNGIVANLTLNNTMGGVITTGSIIRISSALTLTAGTLTTNAGLTLVSSASGTARIAPITGGAVNGNVTVQQYIPGGKRAFRFLGHPFNTAIPLSQLENDIDVTGNGGSTNGFTNTGSNNPSAFYYNPLTGNGSTTNDSTGWIPFTSTNGNGANAWNVKEGIRVLVRGAAGEGLSGNTYTPSAVTLNMNGPVNQGTVIETLQTGASSGYNLLSNPYPSPTDIGTVITNAGSGISGSGYYVWNANSQTQGAYVVQPIGTPYSIPANTSFVVNAAANGATLTFAETNKSATTSDALLKATADNNYIKLEIYDTANNLWDNLYLNLKNAAAATLENMDARKLHNTALDFYSISSDNQQLSIDSRPYTDSTIISLGLATNALQTFIIKAAECNVPAGCQLVLHDKYIGACQPLSNGATYSFTVTGDTASQGNGRFEIGMSGSPTAVNSISLNSLDAVLTPNPASDNVTITYSTATAETVTISILTMAGQKIITKNLGNAQNGNIIIPLQSLAAGMYIVELKAGDKTITKKLIKQN